MSDMPERVWVQKRLFQDIKLVDELDDKGSTEYIRADIAAREVAELRDEVERLRSWIESKRGRFKGGWGSPVEQEIDALLDTKESSDDEG